MHCYRGKEVLPFTFFIDKTPHKHIRTTPFRLLTPFRTALILDDHIGAFQRRLHHTQLATSSLLFQLLILVLAHLHLTQRRLHHTIRTKLRSPVLTRQFQLTHRSRILLHQHYQLLCLLSAQRAPHHRHALLRSPKSPPPQQIPQHHVRHLISTIKVHIQKISHTLPEASQSTLHTLKSTHHLCALKHTIRLTHLHIQSRTQFRSTTPPRIVSQHLIRNLILTLKFRIIPFHLIPHTRTLHQFHHIPPLLRVHTAQSIRPQVRVLMHCRLHTRHPWVKIRLPIHRKAVSLPIRRAKETPFFHSQFGILKIFHYLCSRRKVLTVYFLLII